ncbi:MAG: translocation/assembly module TamB domain-containing protein [Spirochaetaceae bacterium]|jgi:hypothetical protein|nr:translocation/assembly module TamB domain-containing protein [Spirochaetaceae bacterium]
MTSRMTELRDYGITQAENVINRKIRYASMGPSIFGTMDIRNIRISGINTEPVMVISRLRISYSPWKLLKGDMAASIKSVLIDKPVIAVNSERDADLWSILSPYKDLLFAEINSWSTEFLPENLDIRIKGGKCAFVDGANGVTADNVAFNLSVQREQIRVQGQWNVDVFLDGLFNRALKADFSGKIKGEFSGDLQNGLVTLNIPSFETDLFNLRSLTVNSIFAEGKIEVRKIDDHIPFDLHIGYELDSGTLSGEFQSEDFLLRELFSFAGPWAKYNSWLDLRTTGAASFELKPEGDLTYMLDFSGNVPANMAVDIGDTSFHITGKGDHRYAALDKAVLNTPMGSLGFSGGIGFDPWTLDGAISISNLTLSGDGRVDGDFSVSTEGREFTLLGEDISLGSVLISDLDAVIQWEDQGLNFFVSALRFDNIESYEDVRLSQLLLDGSYNFDPRGLQVSFILDAFSLMALIDMVRPFREIPVVPELAAGLVEDISITTELFVQTDFKQVLYNAPSFVVAYGGKQNIVSVFSLSGTDQRFDLEEGRILWADGQTTVSGSADFSNLQDIPFSLQVVYADTSYYFEGFVLEQRSLNIQGGTAYIDQGVYGVSVYVDKTNFGGYSGHIETTAFPIQINGQFAWLTLFFSMSYESETQWSFDISRLEVRDLSTSVSPITAIHLMGRGDQDGAVFSELLFDDGQGLLSGRALLSWANDFSEISGTITMVNSENDEKFTMDGGFNGGSLELHLNVSQIRLGRIIRNSNNILVTGLIDIRWNSWDSFLVGVSLSSVSAWVGETPVRASAQGTLKADECFIENLQVAYGDLTVEFPYFKMNYKTPLAEMDARVKGTALGRDVDVSFTAKASFNPLDSWFDINQALNSFDGALLISHMRLNTLESRAPFLFVFSRTESLISFSGGPDEMIRVRISNDGLFYAGLSNPSPIRGSVSGTVAGGIINAQSSDLNIDLGFLWSFISFKDVEFTGGYLAAMVDIKGPVGDPEFFGTAQGTGIRIRIPKFLTEEIGPTPIALLLDGTMMTFGPLDAKVGSGQGKVSGWFRFDRWIPNNFSIDIQAVQEQAIPFGLEVGGVKAQGLVSGELAVSMENNTLKIIGDLTGHDTEITLDPQGFTGETSAESFDPLSIPVITDILIRTGNKVEFLWPNADYPIIQAYADRGTSLQLKSDSQTRRYAVVGEVKLRSGEIFYIQRSFYLREGTLYFNENEIQFEPRISARAEIRDHSSDGPVTISLIIDQSPLGSFTPRLESNPPLSQIDIISILGQNLTGPSTAGGSDVLANVLSASSDFLAQFRVVRRLERYVRDFTRLDMFSFRSQVLQNAVLDVTRLHVPVNRMSWVSNYFDNTAVFLGKYIGSDMFFQSMFSLRYDENKKTMGGYTFEPDFSIELRNPLFDIRWDFIPRHPEYMFVNDHAVTLTWRRSF